MSRKRSPNWDIKSQNIKKISKKNCYLIQIKFTGILIQTLSRSFKYAITNRKSDLNDSESAEKKQIDYVFSWKTSTQKIKYIGFPIRYSWLGIIINKYDRNYYMNRMQSFLTRNEHRHPLNIRVTYFLSKRNKSHDKYMIK